MDAVFGSIARLSAKKLTSMRNFLALARLADFSKSMHMARIFR
jgi:hypothetical protein